MEIIRLSLNSSNIPVPAEGLRPTTEAPLKFGLENVLHVVTAVKLPDPNNITVGQGLTIATVLGATAQLTLTTVNSVYPVTWLNTGSNKLKCRVRAQIEATFAGNAAGFLSAYNAIVLNGSIDSIPYGGFIVLTIGAAGSGADLILTETNFFSNKFVANINRVSGEF